ncbi:MAG: hypothetical protein V7731_08070 [Amphritea sp.]
MNNLSDTQVESYGLGPNQDSYIAINQEGLVADQCPLSADVFLWMQKHTEHHFLITSIAQALSMIGKPLPEGDIDVMLL